MNASCSVLIPPHTSPCPFFPPTPPPPVFPCRAGGCHHTEVDRLPRLPALRTRHDRSRARTAAGEGTEGATSRVGGGAWERRVRRLSSSKVVSSLGDGGAGTSHPLDAASASLHSHKPSIAAPRGPLRRDFL